MRCRSCSQELSDKAVMCVSCGARPREGNKFCQECGAKTLDSAVVCHSCGVALATLGDEGKDWLVALLLAIFLGVLGIHRFYTGHIAIGIVQLFTFGGCGIWALIDIIMIAVGSFKDVNGNLLIKK